MQLCMASTSELAEWLANATQASKGGFQKDFNTTAKQMCKVSDCLCMMDLKFKANINYSNCDHNSVTLHQFSWLKYFVDIMHCYNDKKEYPLYTHITALHQNIHKLY